MSQNSSLLKTSFDRDGYVYIPGFLSIEAVVTLTNK